MSTTTSDRQAARQWRQKFSAETSSIPRARHQVQAVLRRWASAPDDIDRVVLATSELATNAVCHGGLTGDPFEIRLTLDSRSCLLTVSDTSPRAPRMLAPADDDEHGRGLVLVGRLATQMGVTPRDPVGKTVWARLPIASPHTDPAARHQPVSGCRH